MERADGREAKRLAGIVILILRQRADMGDNGADDRLGLARGLGVLAVPGSFVARRTNVCSYRKRMLPLPANQPRQCRREKRWPSVGHAIARTPTVKRVGQRLLKPRPVRVTGSSRLSQARDVATWSANHA